MILFGESVTGCIKLRIDSPALYFLYSFFSALKKFFMFMFYILSKGAAKSRMPGICRRYKDE